MAILDKEGLVPFSGEMIRGRLVARRRRRVPPRRLPRELVRNWPNRATQIDGKLPDWKLETQSFLLKSDRQAHLTDLGGSEEVAI
jgi:hypothetical protein